MAEPDRPKSVLETYRELAAMETQPGFSTEIVQATDAIMAGRVVTADGMALAVAKTIAISELRAENERLREQLQAAVDHGGYVEGENDRLRAALRETIDLCNALREYAPTLNMVAEKRLRDSLVLIGGEDHG